MHKFAGHEVHTRTKLSDIVIYSTTLNENKQSVRVNKRQTKIRYPHMHTYTNRYSKIGNIIGSVHRIRNQCTYRTDFNEAVLDLADELMTIGYTRTMICACLYKMTRTTEWKTMLSDVISELTHKKEHNKAGLGVRTTPTK